MTERPENQDAERLEAMADLRAYMRIVAQRGELEIVDGADPHLERQR